MIPGEAIRKKLHSKSGYDVLRLGGYVFAFDPLHMKPQVTISWFMIHEGRRLNYFLREELEQV